MRLAFPGVAAVPAIEVWAANIELMPGASMHAPAWHVCKHCLAAKPGS